MNTVYKYPLPRDLSDLESPFQMLLPSGACSLKVAWQDSPYGQGPQLWCLVNPDAPLVGHILQIVPTGGKIGHTTAYLGSFETPEGMMFHVFAMDRRLNPHSPR